MPGYNLAFQESVRFAHDQAVSLVSLYRKALGPEHSSTLRMQAIAERMDEVVRDMDAGRPAFAPDGGERMKLIILQEPTDTLTDSETPEQE